MEISSEEELIEALVQARTNREGEDMSWVKDLVQLPGLPEGDQRQAIMIAVRGGPGEEAQPTGTASGYAPDQEEAPVPEAPWHFFVRVQDNPDAPNYLQPQSLHRLQETETDLFTHRFERETRTWIHNPGMIAFTGADDFQEIDEDEANALISQWTVEQPEEEPETEEAEIDEEEEDEDEEKPLPIP